MAGIEDWNGGSIEPDGGPDLARALADMIQSRPVILLSHQPRAIYSATGRVALMLSGTLTAGKSGPSTIGHLRQPFSKASTTWAGHSLRERKPEYWDAHHWGGAARYEDQAGLAPL